MKLTAKQYVFQSVFLPFVVVGYLAGWAWMGLWAGYLSAERDFIEQKKKPV